MKYATFDKRGLMTGCYTPDVHGELMLPVYGSVPDPTEDDPDPVAPIVGQTRNPAIPEGVIEITDEQWLDIITNAGQRRWDGQAVVPYTPPPAPEPVPSIISDRQFAQALASQGLISREEALAFVRTGAVPLALQSAVDKIQDADQRFAAEMLISGATSFERSNPLIPVIGAILGKDDAALDDLWRLSATL